MFNNNTNTKPDYQKDAPKVIDPKKETPKVIDPNKNAPKVDSKNAAVKK